MNPYTQVPCPSCQRVLRVRTEYSDKVIACNYCHHSFHPKLPVPCPHCGETLNVRIAYLGQRIKCKHCEQTFRPLAEDAPPPPALESASAPTGTRLEFAALEQQAERLRNDLATQAAEHQTTLEQLRQAKDEAAQFREELNGVKAQLEQARADLEQAASLRGELDAARTSSQALNARMKELLERTMEVELLREQLAKREDEQQTLRSELEALQAGQVEERSAEEQRVALLTAELEASRAACQQSSDALAELQGQHQTTVAAHQERLAESSAARTEVDALARFQLNKLQTTHEEHVAGLTAEVESHRQARTRIEAEHQAVGQTAEELRSRLADLTREHESLRIHHDETAAAHAQQLAEMQSELESVRAARQQLEADRRASTRTADELSGKVAALEQAVQKAHEEHTLEREEIRRQADSERLVWQAEWESRIQSQREAHEQALSEERALATTELSSAEARAEDKHRQQLATLSALRAEAEALRQERDTHAVGKAEAQLLREEVERRLQEEIIVLSAEVERRRAEERDAGHRERDLLERLRHLETALETEQDHNSRLSEDQRRQLAQVDAARLTAETTIAELLEKQTQSRARTETLQEEVATLQQASAQAAAERDRIASERQHEQERFAAEIARFEEERTRSAQREAALAESVAERDQLVTALAQEKNRVNAEREQGQQQLAEAAWQGEQHRGLAHEEIEPLLAQVVSLRQERERLAAEKSHAEGTLAASAEQLRAAEAENTLQREARKSLETELETVRAEADRLREEKVHHAEDRARLVAGNQEWQEQLDAIRQQHDQERTAFHEEAAHSRQERERAAARADETAGERDRLAGERADLAIQIQHLQTVLDSTRGQLEAATLQAAEFARQRDENIAGWEAAAMFARTTEQQAREEVAHLASHLERARQELTASWQQHNEAVQRTQSLQAELERQRELVVGLTRELEETHERHLTEHDRQTESALKIDRAREAELLRLRTESTQQAEELARTARAQDVGRTELSEARSRLTAVEKEREEFRAECERLRSERTTAPTMPTVLTRRYDELHTRLEAIVVEVEQPHGVKNAPNKGGFLSRLMGRGGEPKPAEVVPLFRRLDTLRVDVAVERERALRITAEAARAYAEKQLADAQAVLRERGESARLQAQRGEEAITVPFGAKAPNGHQCSLYFRAVFRCGLHFFLEPFLSHRRLQVDAHEIGGDDRHADNVGQFMSHGFTGGVRRQHFFASTATAGNQSGLRQFPDFLAQLQQRELLVDDHAVFHAVFPGMLDGACAQFLKVHAIPLTLVHSQARILAGGGIGHFQIDGNRRHSAQGERKHRQGLAESQGITPDFDLTAGFLPSRSIGDGIESRVFGKLKRLGLLQELNQFVVQIRLSLSDNIHNHQADALLEVSRAFGDERSPGFGTVFVPRTDQFDGCDQCRSAR